MSEAADLLGRLVSVDSVNPVLVPGGAGEGRIAVDVAGWLEGAGLEVLLEEAAPGRPNAVGVAPGTGGGRSLLPVAHTDTVGVTGMERPFAPRVEDGRLYGRGAYDMKAGLAAIMLAGREAARRRLRGDVIVAAVADEEHASVGAEELDRALRASPRHELLGSGSVHCSLVEGGQELSSYPERCLLRVERRTVPGETAEGAWRELQEVIARAGGTDPEFDGSVTVTFARGAFEVERSEQIVEIVRAAAAEVLGREPAIVGHSAWMDSCVLAEAGIPTVIVGPGGQGAHANVEWAELRDIELLVDVLVRAIAEFCG